MTTQPNSLPGQNTIKTFKEIFPFWAPRVVKWRPSGSFGIKIWLNDGNRLYFSNANNTIRLYTMDERDKKGKLIYDSTQNHS